MEFVSSLSNVQAPIDSWVECFESNHQDAHPIDIF